MERNTVVLIAFVTLLIACLSAAAIWDRNQNSTSRILKELGETFKEGERRRIHMEDMKYLNETIELEDQIIRERMKPEGEQNEWLIRDWEQQRKEKEREHERRLLERIERNTREQK